MDNDLTPGPEIEIDVDELISLEGDIAAATSAVQEIERFSSAGGDYAEKVASIEALTSSEALSFK